MFFEWSICIFHRTKLAKIGKKYDEAYKISKKLYPGKPLYLEVRTWNKRAVKCYQSAGYTTDGEPYELTTSIGRGEFYRMVKK